MKKVLLLGASGSIGTQTLDIIRQYPNEFELVGFSVGKNKEKAKEILGEFKSVKCVYISKKEHAKSLKEFHKEISVFSGKCGFRKLIKKSDFDMCVDALVGFVGLEPAIHVLKKPCTEVIFPCARAFTLNSHNRQQVIRIRSILINVFICLSRC